MSFARNWIAAFRLFAFWHGEETFAFAGELPVPRTKTRVALVETRSQGLPRGFTMRLRVELDAPCGRKSTLWSITEAIHWRY